MVSLICTDQGDLILELIPRNRLTALIFFSPVLAWVSGHFALLIPWFIGRTPGAGWLSARAKLTIKPFGYRSVKAVRRLLLTINAPVNENRLLVWRFKPKTPDRTKKALAMEC